MSRNDQIANVIAFGSAIVAGGALFAFAPALVRFQIRMLEWQIEWMKQPWAVLPLRFFGAAFVLLAILGIIQTI